MMKNFICQLVFTTILLFSWVLSSQAQVQVTVLDRSSDQPIAYASVTVVETQESFLTDQNGLVVIGELALPAEIQLTAFTFRNAVFTLTDAQSTFYLELDPVMFDEIIVSDYHIRTDRFDSPTSVSVIQNPIDQSTQGIASLLQEVPGMFVDNSLGEVYSRVYTRGISASAEDDIGWFYQSLLEDGLPITAVQYNYFTPDFFSRPDITISKAEVIRGGKAGILNQNAPGGSINLISKNSSINSAELKTTVGLQGDANPYIRADFYSPVPFNNNKWSAGLGGFYRYDKGHRDTDYPWGLGGQFKGNLQYTGNNSFFALRVKVLSDQVNRHTGMSAVNWNDPEAAFGQNFNSTALMLPEFQSQIGNYSYNPANGIKTDEIALQFDSDFSLGRFRVRNEMKYAMKDLDWQTTFANQPLGLESFLPYFLSGGESPFGLVTFTDVASGNVLAQVNNAGALNVFQGLPPEFEYIQGNLPFDALMGIAPWKKEDNLDEFMNRLTISTDIGSHKLQLGTFFSSSDLAYFTSASYAYATFEPQPRVLRTTLTDFSGNQVNLSDANGVSNYGGLFFESGAFDVTQFSIFANDEIDITSQMALDLGIRYESISHKGSLDIPASRLDLGGEIDTVNVYTNNFMLASGASQSIDFNYDYFSYSAAISYDFTNTLFGFARYSSTRKAPELNFYVQNFSGLPIDQSGEVQEIEQIELGIRHRSQNLQLSGVGFVSTLDNIAFSDFVFDQMTNEIFYAPVQLNKTNTFGLELDWNWQLNDMFSVSGTQTVQNSEAKRYTVYESNGSAATEDDIIRDFAGNELPHTPNLMSRIALSGAYPDLNWTFIWNYMGERFGNIENAFVLPDYSTFDANINFSVSSKAELSLSGKNLFNSDGLMNFFGPNEFGSSANQATREYIEGNPDASFVVFPILPRSLHLSLTMQL